MNTEQKILEDFINHCDNHTMEFRYVSALYKCSCKICSTQYIYDAHSSFTVLKYDTKTKDLVNNDQLAHYLKFN